MIAALVKLNILPLLRTYRPLWA